MITSLNKNMLQDYLNSQLSFHFPDKHNPINFNDSVISKAFSEGLERLENCFSHIKVRGYSKDGQVYFNHLHMDQYSQFLFFFSNSLWKATNDDDLCSRLALLNRCLSSCWLSYKGNLPDIFILMHPVGTVIGHQNVTFSDYLVILQDVTINGVSDGDGTLKIGKGLFLAAGSKIIGSGKIGDRVSVGVNTVLRKPKIENDSIVYTDVIDGGVKIRRSNDNPSHKCMAQNYFYDDLYAKYSRMITN